MLRMSLCGLARSVFWHRKRSSCWPLPRLSVLVSSMLCRIVSLIPGAGVRFPFLSSRDSWQRLRIPPPLLLGLRALLYQPYQMCCERLFVTAGRSKEILKTTVFFWLRKTIHVPTSSRVLNSLFLPLELGRLVVSLRLFFLRRTSLSTRY